MMRAYSVFLALLLLQSAAPAPRGAPSRIADLSAALSVTAVEDGSQAPIEGVTIEMTSGRPSIVPTVGLRSLTNGDGQFNVAGIAPGTYRVAATPPERFRTFTVWSFGVESQVRIVELKPGERLTLHFAFKRPPTVLGQVQTPDGKPVPTVPIELVGWTSTVHERPVLTAIRTVTSDGAGRFVIDRLTPGEYYLRARPPAPPEAPLNFVYAPGATTLRDSIPLLLQSGEEITVGLTLRATPAVTVSGLVLNVRGEPAADVRVTLAALDRTIRPQAAPDGAMRIVPDSTTRSDANGRFAIPHVLQGLYALRAVERRDEKAPVTAAGVAEIDVGNSDVSGVVVSLVPAARLTGRFVFNGAEEPDPARTQLTMAPDGEHGHLRAGLATSNAWHADGQFEVEGIIGPQRLTVGSSGAWYIERATLEDGTEIGNYPYTFVPGRLYPNVRVWVSDRVASVSGPLPPWWDAAGRAAIIVFPEDPSLRTLGSRHVRYATVSTDTGRFSVLGLPPGQVYLLAAFVQWSVQEPLSEPFFQLLTPTAVRIVVDDARPYEVALGALFKR